MIDILFLHGLPDLDDAVAAQWLAELPPDFQQRLSRLRIRKRLVQSLVGLQLLKQLAAAHGTAGFRPDGIRTTALGKPHADDLGDFSISHDGDLVACALAGSGRVGLDVERVQEINIGHFSRVFSAAEFDWIGASRAAFLRALDAQGSRSEGFGRARHRPSADSQRRRCADATR